MQLKHILTASALCFSTAVCAQFLNEPVMTGGTLSSYTRFGVGHLEDASTSDLITTGGSGVALRSSNRINIINPASYSACDSTTFIFDVGMSASFGQMSTATQSNKLRSTRLTNATAMFRIRRGLGMSIGFVPYSSISYNFSGSDFVCFKLLDGKTVSSARLHKGQGGLHNLFAGIGWEPYKRMSVGSNIGYLWGTYSHSITQSFYEDSQVVTTYNGLQTLYDADIKTFKLDVGLQYDIALPRYNRLVVGITAGIGHKMGGDATIMRYTTNGDSIRHTLQRPFDLPWSAGIGLAWHQGKRWTATADYRLEQWGNCHTPQIVGSGANATNMQTGASAGNQINRHRMSAMLEYTPNQYHPSYLQRICYRLGGSYATSYYKVNGNNGPNELAIGAGLGLPVTNKINNRSVVNVGLQWVHSAQQGGGITENYFKVNIGITFNEPWFMKWKIR